MLTLSNLLLATAQHHSARIAIRTDTDTLTWESYVERIARTAGVLRGLGVAAGQRFGVLARNCVAQAQLFNAGYWCGAVPVPLNFRLAPVEIAQMLDDAQCHVLFVDNALLGLLDEPALAGWRRKAIVISVDGPVPAGHLNFDVLLDSTGQPLEPHETHEDDEAILLYTGGTTGRSKGVRLSHRNIVSNALQLSRVMAVSDDDVYLHVSPMFHSTDLKSTVVSMFGGGHVYSSEFSVEGVLRAVARHRVTILSIVPAMIVRLLRDGRLKDQDLSSLRLVSYGTSPIDEGVLRQALQVFAGVGFQQCYGLTETSPVLAVLDDAAHRRALAGRTQLLRAAGRPLPGVSIRFLAEDGREAARGEPGEIVVRGPQVSRGYLNRPEDNEAAFREGWFHTGDIGCFDSEGYLHMLGRRKDMVITGGENVYTREVEQVLAQHPGVAEVAVIGVPDAQYGEALVAAVVLASPPEAPEPDDLIAFCRSQLGGFKIPRRYLFLERLPRTAVGKVKKQELVAEWARHVDAGDASGVDISGSGAHTVV